MRVSVLFGGASEEREVSIASGAEVIRALDGLGHTVVAIDTAHGVLGPAERDRLLASGIAPDPPESAALAVARSRTPALLTGAASWADADVIFIAMHGGSGEDGTLQAVSTLSACPTPVRVTSAARSRWTRTSPSGCSLRPVCRRRRGAWRRRSRTTPSRRLGCRSS